MNRQRKGFWRKLEQSLRKRRKRWQAAWGFDREWYLENNPDVARAGLDPLAHYVEHGQREGRRKSARQGGSVRNPRDWSRGTELPVLWILFNRPELTRQSLAAIRAVRPKRLFIACDGPRTGRPGEHEKVESVRRMAEAVDWPCEVRRLYHRKNLGCGRAVAAAVSWFFEQVEEGVILEDDCVASPDFFWFCETMLARHRLDGRIATIGGTHFLPRAFRAELSHYGSKYFQMWGWASWRRTWALYRYDLNELPEEEWVRILDRTHTTLFERSVWLQKWRAIAGGQIDTWDFQMIFSAWRHGMFHIMPSRNLVSNIGYGEDATHTNFASPVANLPVGALHRIDNLARVDPAAEVDDLIFFIRYLDSARHTHWMEKALGDRFEREVAEIRNELAAKRRALKNLAQRQ